MGSGQGNMLTFGLSSAIYDECNQCMFCAAIKTLYFSSGGLSLE